MKHHILKVGTELSRLKAADEECIWHDILLQDSQELTLAIQNFPESVQNEVLETSHFPEVTSLKGGLLLHMPLRQTWDAESSSYVTFLIFPHALTTISYVDNLKLRLLRQRIDQGEAQEIQDIPSLFAAIIDEIVDYNIHIYTIAKHEAEKLGDQLSDCPNTVSQKDILQLRRQVGRLLSQFEEQFYSLTSLRSLLQTAKILPTLVITDIWDAQAHLVSSMTRLEVRLRDLQQYHQYILQSHTEKRLRYLTIITSIFMPLTLITGLYGMNFKYMPELEYQYGYYILICSMVTLALVLIYTFHKRGWFK